MFWFQGVNQDQYHKQLPYILNDDLLINCKLQELYPRFIWGLHIINFEV